MRRLGQDDIVKKFNDAGKAYIDNECNLTQPSSCVRQLTGGLGQGTHLVHRVLEFDDSASGECAFFGSAVFVCRTQLVI